MYLDTTTTGASSNRRPGWLLPALALLSLLSFAPAAFGDGFIYVPRPHIIPRPPTPHPIPRPIPRPSFPLRVTRHHVSVEIDGNVARTRVDERFYNPNPYQMEGTYLFPLPPGASIASFSMSMNGKNVEGEVLEKEKARSIYESIVRQMKDPGLLEYIERGLFRARVFPIPASGNVDVRIAYDENLPVDHGHARYHYPLDTGKYSAGDYQDVLLDVRIRSAAPIRNIQCPSHNVQITRVSDAEVRVSFEAKTLAADKDFVLDWNVSEDALAPMLLAHRGSEELGFFHLSLSPRLDRAASVPPKDLVLILDTSGSMLGPKMDDARRAVKYCINGLNAEDRFNVIDFSSEARRFREGVVPATAENRRAALAYVDGLQARGGTHVEDALRAAFPSSGGEARLRIACLITDGEPTLGLTRPEDLLGLVKELNRARTRLFCFGVGVELNTILLERLARENHGAVDYVLPGEQLEIKLSNFYDKIHQPVLTDLKIEFLGLAAQDVYPRPLPDLFRGEQLTVVGRHRSDGRHTVVLRGKYMGTEKVFEYSLDFQPASSGSRNDFIPRMWAARKLGYLLEAIRLSGEKKELKDEVIRLSKRYGILTPYTSYLILEDTARRPAGPVAGGRPASRVLRRVRAADRSAGTEMAESAEALGKAQGRSGVSAARKVRSLKEGKLDEAESYIQERVNRGETRHRLVAGRSFYFTDGRWLDGSLGTRSIEGGRRIVYLSEEYFEFLRRNPGAGRLLSLGESVVFLWKGEVIHVVAGS